MQARIENPAVTVPGAMQALRRRINAVTRQVTGEWVGQWVNAGDGVAHAA